MGGICLKTPSNKYHQLRLKDTEHIITKVGPQFEGFDISEDIICDLGKSDELAKTFACVQTLWFITQIISRICQHKAVTLLEATTSAYAFCAILAYAAWWKKAQDCSVPMIFPVSDDTIKGLQPPQHLGMVGT